MTPKQKALELSAFYALLAQNDNGFKYKNSSFIYGDNGPHMGIENISDFQVNPPKPVLQTIDLSMMVGSDILMEFKDHNYATWQEIGFLNCISGQTLKEYSYVDKHLERWKCCRIMQDHWHSWQGRANCPLPEGLIVEVIYRGERNEILLPEYTEATWTWRGLDASDIIAFRILGTTEGWRYEWDKDE